MHIEQIGTKTTSNLDHFVKNSLDCNDEESLRNKFEHYLSFYGYKMFLVRVLDIRANSVDIDLYNNLPENLNEICQNLIHAGEHPIFQNSDRLLTPFFLQDLPCDVRESPSQAENWNAYVAGLANGVALPVYISDRLRALVLLAGTDADTSLRSIHEIHVAVFYLIKQWLKIREDTAEASPPQQKKFVLTDRERQCLLLSARGLYEAWIATQLGISPHTVRAHVENAKRKLRASNKSHAIALAISRGEIAISELS